MKITIVQFDNLQEAKIIYKELSTIKGFRQRSNFKIDFHYPETCDLSEPRFYPF